MISSLGMLELSASAQSLREVPDFLAGGGEMGQRMRQAQWTRTPLGPASDWPQPLRNAVRMMLASRQPMALLWGERLCTLYNDACRALLGANHPSALGMAAEVVWGEWWEELEATADAAIRRHEGRSPGPLRMIVQRQGFSCESYFRIASHPVPGERGSIGGVLWSFEDVTAAVLRERELQGIEALRLAMAGAADVLDLCARAGEALASASEDLPFAALYAVDAERSEARLLGRSGCPHASEALPEAIMLGDACVWPIAAALQSRSASLVELDDPRFGLLPQSSWDRAPRQAVIVPIAPLMEGAHLVLIAGLNPYRVFDDALERFVELLRSQIVAALGSCREIARERELAALRERVRVMGEATEELRDLDRRKTEFLATLAHELRNPLAPLRNGLEVIRLAGGDGAKVEKARGMMQRQLQQMVRLVDDLLDVTRVTRGKIELRPADVELASVLKTAIEASQPLMGERGHSLEARVPMERIVVRGDAARLSQVFCNLLNNAAKYTEAGGAIELGASFEDGHAVVRVKDNGIGIPPEMLSRVFDMFTQVDRSLERAQGGLGIGLHIARRLVEMHGGTIEVESPGHRQGTEFTVRLPARIERAVAASDYEPRAPACMGKRILIADDNEDSAETLKIMLEVMGNEVHVARDGEEAVQAAASFNPDAILMDIGMPKMNGYDACAAIRARGCGALIVALTGWSQEEDKTRSKAAGFDRHLVKPVEPRTLEGIIRSVK